MNEETMAYQTEAVTMWFDRRLVMRRSPIHGTGTFATHAIHAGERLIWVTGGIVYTSEDWRTGRVQLGGEQYNEGQIDDDLFIATPKSLYYYVNHSCDPNMLNETAWRDIEAGEEITTDFAYCEADPDYLLEPCSCGSRRCRGRVTGNDWQLPELQQRYRGYFTPHIERLIQRAHTGANTHG
jgi:SET domain-containing protein